MAINAKIIKDSINRHNACRLTTFEVEFPRFINAEILRHRMLSFNSAPSRAIPMKKILEAVRNDPAMPVWWGRNQAGMQAAEELTEEEREKALALWLEARDGAVAFLERFIELDLHKQISNRIVEPWQNIKLIVSGTDWQNFFALRVSKFAQPEFRELASQMLEIYNENVPDVLHHGEWHIPYSDRMKMDMTEDERLRVSTARCTRGSYLTQDGEINYVKDFELFERLTTGGHWSPTEHPARAEAHPHYYGNFRGFKQFRKFFLNENQADTRVRSNVDKLREALAKTPREVPEGTPAVIF